MSGVEAVLASRATFVLAALAVSWIAVALLALVAANLHVRLVRLERAQPASSSRTPFGHLVGRVLADVLGPGVAPGTRLAIVLSADCPTCERILAALRESAGGAPVALLWRDGAPPPQMLPPGAAVVADGAGVSRVLGVRVTPFALAADAAGRIVHAAPVGSVEALSDLLGDAGGERSAGVSSTPLSHQPLKGVSS